MGQCAPRLAAVCHEHHVPNVGYDRRCTRSSPPSVEPWDCVDSSAPANSSRALGSRRRNLDAWLGSSRQRLTLTKGKIGATTACDDSCARCTAVKDTDRKFSPV